MWVFVCVCVFVCAVPRVAPLTQNASATPRTKFPTSEEGLGGEVGVVALGVLLGHVQELEATQGVALLGEGRLRGACTDWKPSANVSDTLQEPAPPWQPCLLAPPCSGSAPGLARPDRAGRRQA